MRHADDVMEKDVYAKTFYVQMYHSSFAKSSSEVLHMLLFSHFGNREPKNNMEVCFIQGLSTNVDTNELYLFVNNFWEIVSSTLYSI